MTEKMQLFYKNQQTTLEKSMNTLEKTQEMQLTIIKSYAKLGFLHEFTNDTGKKFECFRQSYNNLCQNLVYLKKNFGIWEIKAFADVIMLKLLSI